MHAYCFILRDYYVLKKLYPGVNATPQFLQIPKTPITGDLDILTISEGVLLGTATLINSV